MAKCSGCSSTDCNCGFEVVDSDTVNLTLDGSGGPGDPYILMAEASVEDLAIFSRTDDLTAGTGVGRFRFPFDATILEVTAIVNTAPTGADIILDVNKNGVTIFTTQANRPRIVAGSFDTASPATPDVTAVVTGDYLTVDRDQVGSGVAGADLTVEVLYRRN